MSTFSSRFRTASLASTLVSTRATTLVPLLIPSKRELKSRLICLSGLNAAGFGDTKYAGVRTPGTGIAPSVLAAAIVALKRMAPAAMATLANAAPGIRTFQGEKRFVTGDLG